MSKFDEIAAATRSAAIAFFDLDVTLTDADTDVLWAKWQMRRSPIAWFKYLALMRLYRKYKAGSLTEEELIRFQRVRIGRKSPFAFKAMCHRFFEEVGRNHVYPEAKLLIEAHKNNGSRVVLITAQHDMVAAPFAHFLRVDDLVASRIETSGDRFFGPVRPYCFMEGKKRWAVEYAKSLNVSLSGCAFYSDSRNDLPMLESVGFPVATNPDPVLEAVARERKWQILKFH